MIRFWPSDHDTKKIYTSFGQAISKLYFVPQGKSKCVHWLWECNLIYQFSWRKRMVADRDNCTEINDLECCLSFRRKLISIKCSKAMQSQKDFQRAFCQRLWLLKNILITFSYFEYTVFFILSMLNFGKSEIFFFINMLNKYLDTKRGGFGALLLPMNL